MKKLLVLFGLPMLSVASAAALDFEFDGTELNAVRAGVLALLTLGAAVYVGFRAIKVFKRAGRQV